MSYNLLEMLRSEAAEAKDCAEDARTPEYARAPFAYMYELLTNAANRIETDAKIFAVHQAAWKANNESHAERIEALEQELKCAGVLRTQFTAEQVAAATAAAVAALTK